MGPLLRFALKTGVVQLHPRHVDAFREREDVAMLIRAAADRWFRVRLAAIRALAEVGGREAITPIRKALRDPVKEVALVAIELLVRLDAGSAEAVAGAEAYWAARARRKNEPLPTVEGKLIDGEKLRRFQEFKRKVLAQAGKGQFYG